MKRLALCLILSMAMLTGCLGDPLVGAGSETNGPTPSSKVSSTASTPAPSINQVSYPEGASVDGLTPKTIKRTHHDGLKEAGNYSIHFESSSVGPNSTSTVSMEGEVSLRQDIVNYTAHSDLHHQNSTYDVYNREGTGFERSRGGEKISYSRTPRNTSAQYVTTLTSTHIVGGLITRYNFTATETETEDGTVLINYQSTGINNSAVGTGIFGTAEFTNNSSANLTIDEFGIVRTVSARASTESGYKLTVSMNVSDIGETTVTKPAWIGTAESKTTPLHSTQKTPTTPSEPERTPVPGPDIDLDWEQETRILETEAGNISTKVITFSHQAGDLVDRGNLHVEVKRANGPTLQGYDVEALRVPNGRLEAVDPLSGHGELGPSDTIRVVHVVPPEHQDSMRLSSENGTITAGDGAVSDGGIHQGDAVKVIWSHEENSQALAVYVVGDS